MDVFLDREAMFKTMLIVIYLWLLLSLLLLLCSTSDFVVDKIIRMMRWGWHDYFSTGYFPNLIAAKNNQLSRLGKSQSREDSLSPREYELLHLTLSIATMLTDPPKFSLIYTLFCQIEAKKQNKLCWEMYPDLRVSKHFI